MDKYNLKKVPSHVEDELYRRGVERDSIYAGICADMTPEGEYCDFWLVAGKDGFYAIWGLAKAIPHKTVFKGWLFPRKTKIDMEFDVFGFKLYPYNEFSDIKTEPILSATRFFIENDSESNIICLFETGKALILEQYIKIIKKLKANETLCDDDYKIDDALFCPKCGLPYPEPERKICPKCMSKKGVLWRLLVIFKEFWWKIALIFLVLCSSAAVSLISPYISNQIFFSEVLEPAGQHYGNMIGFILVLVAASLLSSGIWTLFGVLQGLIAPRMVYSLKTLMFKKIQSLSLGFFSSRQTGSLMNRINSDAESIYWLILESLPQLFVQGLMIIGAAIVMFSMNFWLAFFAVLVLPISFIVIILGVDFMIKMFIRRYHKSSTQNAILNDSLTGLRVVKAFAKESREISRFKKASDDLAEADRTVNVTIGTIYPIFGFLMNISRFIVWGIGGWMVINSNLDFGGMMTFSAYLSMIIGPLDYMAWMISGLSDKISSASRIFEVMDAIPDVLEAENAISKTEFDGTVDFENVSFRYEEKKPVLEEVSLKVGKGQTLGIVGRTGAGKTTLINLLMRLYDVKSGIIKIDDIDIKDISFKSLHDNIAVVSQEIYLFMGTISENIKYSRPQATQEEIIMAAKAAGAHGFIMKLPDAYETRIGVGGSDLSGGERQRISIARAILHNPKILLLDEATASMDTETELHIQASLNKLKKGRTTIIIAHRLSTLRDADYLVVIDNGKLSESGTHEELIRQKGTYYTLYKIQSEALKSAGIV